MPNNFLYEFIEKYIKIQNLKMENVTFTDFSVATDFVKDAMDEYYTTKNWTGLLERYWMLIEEQIGGKFR